MPEQRVSDRPSSAVESVPEPSSTATPERRRGRPPWGAVVSGATLAIVLLCAAVPGLVSGYDPIATDPGASLRGPSWTHLFGTDVLGRDLFARVVHGAQATLSATVVALVLALIVGGLVGLVAGMRGGWFDSAAMRCVDVLLSIPNLLVSLMLVTALGFGTINIAIAVGAGSVASFSRVMRGEVLRVRTSAFAEAAYMTGARTTTVMFRHVLPNAVRPLLALAALEFGAAILSIASLSFLGFGTPPPWPEWGSLIAEGRSYLASAWWLTTLPGVVVLVTVLAANRLSRRFVAAIRR